MPPLNASKLFIISADLHIHFRDTLLILFLNLTKNAQQLQRKRSFPGCKNLRILVHIQPISYRYVYTVLFEHYYLDQKRTKHD